MKQCCCGAVEPTPWTRYCDPCPEPFEGSQQVIHEVIVNSPGIKNCAIGNGYQNQYIGCCGCCQVGDSCELQPLVYRYTDYADGGTLYACQAVPPPGGFDTVCTEVCPAQESVCPSGDAYGRLEIIGCPDNDSNCTVATPGCQAPANPNCVGAINDYDFEYISFMGIERCRAPKRQGDTCVFNAWGETVAGPDINNKMYSVVTVSFYTPTCPWYQAEYVCNPQGQELEPICFYTGPYIAGGLGVTCVYARAQRNCEYYAVGEYRLVRVVGTTCYASLIQNPNTPSCSGSFNNCPGACEGLITTCDWDQGISTKEFCGVWKPPSVITVTRSA